MKGDFSRIRFNPGKQYTAVLEQQGRVSIDADANEQAAIDDYLRRTETADVIGAFGAPEHDPGFAISVSGNQILIGAGRYYVQGLVCENRNDGLAYLSQPYLLNPSPTDSILLNELTQAGGSSAVQLFLQVWQRLVTALDDPCLREPALGQADTTARLQTVWRVVATLVPPLPPPPPSSTFGNISASSIFRRTSLLEARQNLAAEISDIAAIRNVAGLRSTVSPAATTPAAGTVAPAVDCCTSMYANTPTLSTGAMKVSTAAAGSDCSCEPTPSAGYQGLENQLYRIEIHQGGTETTATFKWSRENGSVVSAITTFTGNTLVVESLGPDANLGFQTNQWVEVFDGSDLFGETPNSPGLLYQIQSIDPTVPSITLTTPIIGINPALNARVRRWEQTGPSATSAGVPLAVSTPLTLENGIEVTFRPGTYQAGDYWTAPARTASGQIDWPPCGSSGDLFQPPHSALVYNAPLACIHWDPKQQNAVVEDCRRFFLPLTEINAVTSKALHVIGINWSNDSLITADVWVANGLTVTLDGSPSSPISNGNFIVTLESIFNPFTATNTGLALSSRAINLQPPSTFLRTCFALDSTLAVNGPSISWTMPYLNAPPLQVFTVNAINTGLLFGAAFGQYARVRIRLVGDTISSGVGDGQLFLDGQCLGQPLTLPDGTARIDLQLPSSSGERSSDFESWFYLAPTLLIANLIVAFSDLFILLDNFNNITGVSATAPNPTTGVSGSPVNPIATVTTNYPALADTQITLSVLDSTGVPSTFAQIQSPITVHAGEVSVNAAIGIIGNPLNNAVATTVTITVAASIATAVGPIAANSANFNLTGTTPVPIIG
jgi:Family of unknown function (DUF6519)